RLSAIPQYAIAHAGSSFTVASNASMARANSNEWSRATARSNGRCAGRLHEVGKWTVPSFSTAVPPCSCSCATAEAGALTSRIAAVEQSVACRRRLAGMVVAYTVPTASNSNNSADDPSFPPRFAMNTPVRTRLAFPLRWLAGIRRLEAAVFVLGLAVLGTAGPTIHGHQ